MPLLAALDEAAQAIEPVPHFNLAARSEQCTPVHMNLYVGAADAPA